MTIENSIQHRFYCILNDLLTLKADASSVSALSTKIGSLESSLNDYKTEVSGKFEAIEDRLTWHGLQ